MSRRMWLNLGLLVLVAALAWIAYEEPGLEKSGERTHLTALKPEQVTQITIKRPGKEDLVFVRENGWWMHAPVRVAANVFRIDSVLGITRAQWRGRYTVAGLELEKYGLDKPLATVLFNDVKIEFGGKEPLKRHRYVKTGSHVYLINDTLYYQLQAPPEAYVSLALVPPGNELTSIRLAGLELINRQGRWRSIAEGRHKPAVMDAIVDAWRHARASRVVPYGGEAAEGEILLRLSREPADLRLAILQRAPALILARRDIGMSYYFPAEQTQRLLPGDIADAVADQVSM